MIRNILWGVDGTLFDTHPAITYAVSKSLNEMGLTVAMNELDGLTRQSIDQCITALAIRFKLDPDLLRLRFAETYRKIPPANQPPFPGARDLCVLIRKRGGSNLIITHRSAESTQQLLEAHKLDHFIAGIFSTDQGFPHKPHSAMPETAIQRFHLDRSETLLIGDHDIDIQAGLAAGVHTCLFGGVQLSKLAEHQFTSYDQILEWLSKQGQKED